MYYIVGGSIVGKWHLGASSTRAVVEGEIDAESDTVEAYNDDASHHIRTRLASGIKSTCQFCKNQVHEEWVHQK